MTPGALSGMLALALAAVLVAAWRPGSRFARAVVAGTLATSGALLALAGALALWRPAPPLALVLPPPFGTLPVGLEGLAAGGALLAGALCVAAGLWRAAGVGAGGSGTGLLVHLLLLSVAWFLASRTPLGWLVGWAAVSAATYFALVRDRPRVRRAAWALLALSELGTSLLLAVALALPPAGHGALPAAGALAVALLALFAFGAKAGLLPLQVWMPLAEPEAPGDVAGLFSGLVTAVAVIGFLRVVRQAAPPLLPLGAVAVAVGLAGAAASALTALVERDAKRVLAYGTLEALGLVFAALGAGMVLEAAGAGSAAVMAVAGGLVLLLAHAGAKFTLFALAGFVEERQRLRLLDRMGGLLRRMPRGAGPLVLAVATLAGLPPLGGFLGEWLFIEACLVPLPRDPGLHVALGVLAALVAVVAALGLTAYLRWAGIGFLGPARSAAAARSPDLPGTAAAGLWLAALVGGAAGVAAGWVLPWLAGATAWLARGQPLVAATYLHPQAYGTIVALGAALFRGVAGRSGNVIFAAGGFDVASPWDLALAGLLLGGAVAWCTGRLGRRRRVRTVRTWVGGEPDDDRRLAWTAEAFAHPLRLTFAAFFGLERRRLPLGHPLQGGLRYRARVVLRLEHHVYRPLLAFAARASGAVRHGVQSGDLSRYVAYVLAFAIVGLAVATFVR